MSNDWKKQLVELSKNEEFQKKQTEIAEKFKGDEAAMKEEIVKLLAEHGIVEPEEGFKASVKELSDDELGAVAGGSVGSFSYIECGSGVHYNGEVGSYPNPKAKDLGMSPIGHYQTSSDPLFTKGMSDEQKSETRGLSKGADDSWVYFNGEEFRTSKGTKSTRFLYDTVIALKYKIKEMAKEVMEDD